MGNFHDIFQKMDQLAIISKTFLCMKNTFIHVKVNKFFKFFVLVQSSEYYSTCSMLYICYAFSLQFINKNGVMINVIWHIV